MQDRALSLPLVLQRAERHFWHKRVVTNQIGYRQSATFGEVAARVRRLATVLDQLDVPADARVGTFAWNTQRHLELYLAVPCTNRVLHTVNHRLFAEQITFIANDARDDVLFVDRSNLGVVWPLIDTLCHSALRRRDG